MSIDRRQYAVAYGASSASASPTFASAVLVGSTIIVITCSQFPVQSVTDNKGNSYAVDARATQNGSHIGIFRAYVTTGGSGLTVTAATGSPGPIVMSVQEVPNVLIVDQTRAGTAIGASASMDLSGRFAQSQSVYAVYGACVQLPGAFLFTGEHGWRGLEASGSNSSQALGTLDHSFQWNSTSGALIADATTGSTALALITLCMATYIEAVVADFSGTPLSGAAPLTVVFTDASTGSPDQWLYEFGDGQTSASQNPTHQYAAAGTYTVRLTAKRFDTPTSQKTRSSYVVAGTGGSGGGGTDSAISSHDPWSGTLVPGLPYPPMLGSPWAVQSRPPRPIEPAPPSPAVAREVPMLLSAGGGSPARKERDSRALALIANALLRSEQFQQSSDSEFGILTGGFDADRAPTEDDDATAGVISGVPWVDSSGSARKAEALETNPGPDVYFCVEDQAGVATWFRVATRSDGRVTGGVSGSFP